MLSELTDRVKSMLSGFGSKPISLGLKYAAGENIGFDLMDAAWHARRGFNGVASALGGWAPAWSGESVTVDTALNHSVFYTCKRIISESTGFLPLSMMQQKGDDKTDATWHPMFAGLQHAPNDEMPAMRFRETLTGHCAVGGNAYAQIIRRSGTGVAMELWPLLPAQVTPQRERTGLKRLVYLVRDGNSAEKTYTVERNKPHDIFHMPGLGWDGIRGYSVLTLARQSLGTQLATERNVARFFANGGRLPYYLKLKETMDDEQFKRFRADWEAIYAEPHRAPILEPYIEEYKQIGLSAVDSQLLETRQFGIPEICRWFRISPHLAGDLSRATFSNIEQLALEFVNFTLMVWLKRWEQELWRCILTPEEKGQGYFWRHNVNALLRGDFKARMEGYASALQNGHMNVDEVRDLEDRNALPDGAGQDYHIQLNMQPLPADAKPAQSLVRLGKERIRA